MAALRGARNPGFWGQVSSPEGYGALRRSEIGV